MSIKWSEILPQNALDLSVQLENRALEERKAGRNICPPQEQIFRALQLTPPEKVKVCIVGQDPYHTPGQANGLAFSIAPGNPLQPSLINIFNELEQDIGIPRPITGDLTRWAEKGVLLLNTSLTVYEHQANSHAGWGWNNFTKAVLQAAHNLPQPIVYILWGANAQELLDDLITCAAVYHDNNKVVTENLVKKAYILSSHPSPFSANRTCRGTPAFKGSKPFSTANQLLANMGVNKLIGLLTDDLKNEFEQILIYSQAYPFSIDSTKTLEQWAKAKRPFVKVFGRKTIWRSEHPIKIELSENLRQRRFNEFMDECEKEKLLDNDDFYTFLKENSQGFFENRVIKDFPQKDIRQGSKLLRSFKHFFSDRDIIRWAQDTASRYIQEDKIEGYLYLSVDPRDFLTLSENNSKWISCHSLDGEYRAGNLNYMVDDTTIIAYIAGIEKENLKCIPKNIKWYDKKWRMLVHVNRKGTVYYNKQYPFQHQILLDIVDRAIMNLFFPKNKMSFTGPMDIGIREVVLPTGEIENLNRNMLWAGGRIYDSKQIINDIEGLGYTDLIDSKNYTPIVSTLESSYNEYLKKKDSDSEDQDKVFHNIFDITIGRKVICPCCGEGILKKTNSFLCNDCIVEEDADEDFYCFCSNCGRHLYDGDEYVVVGDELLCMDCNKELEELESDD